MNFTRCVGRITTPEYTDALASAEAVLDPWSGADGNISNHFLLDGRRATVPFTAHGRDLLDMASMVYIADELVPRSSTADTWTRRFSFTSPVYERERCMETWLSESPELALRMLAAHIGGLRQGACHRAGRKAKRAAEQRRLTEDARMGQLEKESA